MNQTAVAKKVSPRARKEYEEKCEAKSRVYVKGPIQELLGAGNIAGYDDYQAGTTRDLSECDPIYVRGYTAAQEMAKKGKRPQLIMLREDYPDIFRDLNSYPA